jgi:hypothetical protein
VQGLNVMSTAEYEMATQMGVFPFLHHGWDFIDLPNIAMGLYARLSLWLWYCMHDYVYKGCIHYYEFMAMLFVCNISPMLWCGLFTLKCA